MLEDVLLTKVIMGKLPSANKALGQHFLTDQKTISMITSDFASEADIIIEVGPGPGVLTKKLSELKLPLYLIEKDDRFIEDLKDLTPHVFNQDALEFDWKRFLKPFSGKKIWLVSNLPYNVGTPLFLKFLQLEQIKLMTLMFQKEVGEKTYLREQKNTTSGLLTLSSIYFDSKVLRKVPPGCFSPPPKVHSIVVSYQRKENPQFCLNEFSEVDRWTRIIFSQKRKQLGTVLKGSINADQLEKLKELKPEILKARSESLSLNQIYDLVSHLRSL